MSESDVPALLGFDSNLFSILKWGSMILPHSFETKSNIKRATPNKLKRANRTACKTRLLSVENLEVRQLMAVDLNVDINSYSTDRLLVQLRSDSTPAAISQSLHGVSQLESIGESDWYQVSLSAETALSTAIQRLQALREVVTVTPDFRVGLTSTPNDPMFVNQWPLSTNANSAGRIEASQAWNFGTSSNIVVAVIDTGVDYNHPDLAANIWANSREISGNGIDDDGNGYRDDVRGWNFVGNNNSPMDDNGHGTHVAGTIGAVGNNGIGVAGVAWNVKLMPLKFLDSQGSGFLSDAVRAVDYARVNGAKIINASFGGGGFSSAMQSALQRFQQAGGVFVAAAGNEGANNATTASYPANYPLSNVVSVAASTQSNALASFSNFGSNVDIAAPGQNILSTLPGGRYGSLSGTSMAAPHVAGALALLWGQSPALSATQLVNLVMSNTDSVLVGKTIHGKLNIGKAAALSGNSAGNTDSTAPFVESAQWVQNAGAVDSLILDFSEEMNRDSVASSITVTGPNGPVTVSSIQKSATDSTKYVIRLGGSNTGVGNYQIDLASTARDLVGNRLNQDRDGQWGEADQDCFSSSTVLSKTDSSVSSYSSASNVKLQDASFLRAGTTRVFVDVPDATTISNISVDLSINHTYVSDLRVRLISPSGRTVTLVNRRGGNSQNLELNFADSAASSIASVRTKLSGSFQPETPLSALRGQNSQGRWTLEIVDLATVDTGLLKSAKLYIEAATKSSVITSATQDLAVQASIWQLVESLFRRRR